jgi:hypothetical protein
MRRSLPLAVVLAVLAIAAPAQAQITASTITSPADPHFVLIDADAPAAPTVSISGTATGTGSVDIVCLRDYVHDGDVFASSVPVAADGTFAVSDVPLITQNGVRHPTSNEGTCRLVAWPAGTTPADRSAFTGPRLAISKLARQRLNAGPNAGLVSTAYVVASGIGFSTLGTTLGAAGFNQANVLDPATFGPLRSGFYPSAGLGFDWNRPRFPLEVDGEAAYPPTFASSGIGSTATYANPGVVGLEVDVTRFSPTTGDLSVRESGRLVRCAPDNAYPPTADRCEHFAPAPVTYERTTEYSHGNQVVRVVDRWISTDGRPHRLDLSLVTAPCLGSGYDCSAKVRYRFPGDAGYAEHPDGTSTGAVGPGAILARDATDATRGGIALIIGRRADSARFHRDTYNDTFALDYRAAAIPARGSLTLSHTYVTTRSAADIEALAAALTPKPAPPAQPHGTPAPEPAATPVLTRHGHLRVKRSGRTFLVRTRDWVQCPAACVLRVRGSRVRAAQTTVAAGAAARVAVKLNRRGARALMRKRRLRVTLSIAARVGNGAPVTAVRRLTLAL